jgi:hypothetical protein
MHELTSLRLPLDSHRYRSAFLLCRRHRIDLNILHDHDPEAFKAHLSDFITQVKDVDHLNLFLSGLKDEDVTKTMYRPLVASVKDLSVTPFPSVSLSDHPGSRCFYILGAATRPTRSTRSVTSCERTSRSATCSTMRIRS